MTSLLDHPLLSARYLFPRRGSLDGASFVTAADGTSRLGCYRSTPHGREAPLILHFHGNAEIVADYVPAVAAIFNAIGVNVVFAEYRGYGASTGAAPSLGSMLDDAEAVFRTIDAPVDRVVPFGRSLGSLFASEVAGRHPDVGGLILESGIATPLEPAIARVSADDLGVPVSELQRAVTERFDQKTKLGRFRGPLLVLHTAADALIPVSQGERLFEWGGAPAEDKKLVVFAQGDHGTIFPMNRAAYVAELAAFFSRMKRRPA